MALQSNPVTKDAHDPVDMLRREIHAAIGRLSRRMDGDGKLLLGNEDVRWLRQAANRHLQNLRRVRRLWMRDARPAFNDARDLYLGSWNARVCGAIRAFDRRKVAVDFDCILKKAEAVDLWTPLREAVRLELKPKRSGGSRPILKFGPRRLVQQFVVLDLLSVLQVDGEFDFCRRGAGGERGFVGAVCQGLEQGLTAWQASDVKGFFVSLRPAHFGWLPVPKKIIRHVAFLPQCAEIRLVSNMDLGPKGKIQKASELDEEVASPLSSVTPIKEEPLSIDGTGLGLPQGAVLSPLLARASLGRWIRAEQPGPEIVVFAYVDDLILGARQAGDVEAFLDSLRRRLGELQAGPIELKIDPRMSARSGRLKALRYNLEPGRRQGGGVHVKPGRSRFEPFYDRVAREWLAEGRSAGSHAFQQFIADKLRGFQANKRGPLFQGTAGMCRSPRRSSKLRTGCVESRRSGLGRMLRQRH